MFDDVPDELLSPEKRELLEQIQATAAEWFQFHADLTMVSEVPPKWELHLSLRTMLIPFDAPPLFDVYGEGPTPDAAANHLGSVILAMLDRSLERDIDACRVELDAVLRVAR